LIDLAITKIDLVALVYIYDHQLFNEMQKKFGSSSPNMKYFLEPIGILSSKTDLELIDEFIGKVEDKTTFPTYSYG